MKKLGFGFMRFPQADPEVKNSIDMEEARKMVDRFIEAGYKYFDTGYYYLGGNSERAIGELVAKRYPRDSFILTDKLPFFMLGGREEYEPVFEEQLKRCQVEYFDNYFLHAVGKSFDGLLETNKAFEFLLEKKKEGKVKHIGFSYHDDAAYLDEVLTRYPETELVQLQLNYLDWTDQSVQAKKCYDVCVKHGKKVVVMEPVKGGSLAEVPEEAEKVLKGMAPEMSIPSWGIRFAASLENVYMVLSGMSNMAQLEDNIATMDSFKPLSDEELKALESTVEIIRKSIAIPCTACRYCVDTCPMNVAIPEYFAVYNDCEKFGKKPGLVTLFNNLTINHGKPSACIACGQCESHCPQHLPIIENLKLVSEIFEKKKKK